MPSAVVNQGAETLFGGGKNHDHDRGVLHDHEKHGSNPRKIRGFRVFTLSNHGITSYLFFDNFNW